jgi:hypothetical protein
MGQRRPCVMLLNIITNEKHIGDTCERSPQKRLH